MQACGCYWWHWSYDTRIYGVKGLQRRSINKYTYNYTTKLIFFSFLMCESVWNSILKGSREAVNIFKFEQHAAWWRTFNFRLTSYIYIKAPTVFGITSRTCQPHLPAVMTPSLVFLFIQVYTPFPFSCSMWTTGFIWACASRVCRFCCFVLFLKLKTEDKSRVCICVTEKKDLFRLKQQQTGGGGEPCLCSWDA